MKLFIPGPVHLRPEIRQEMSRTMVGHRDQAFVELFTPVLEKLKKVLYTEQNVFVATCSGSGLWEMGIRNLCRKKVLCATCGAFSERWADAAEANGRQVTRLSVEWGRPNLPETIAEALGKDGYDAFAMVHNETSTGLTNPLEEIGEVLRDFPGVISMVDAVSSMAGLKIEFDRLGIDFLMASSQKALALPPGIAICAVSERAMERAGTIANRGYYFDLLEYRRRAAKGQTVTTPSIPHIHALSRQLDDILAEGLDSRFRRHREMAEVVRAWAREHFAIFPEEEYASDTVTTIRNTRGISVADLNAQLLEQHDCVIANGYGKLKDETFRISHMGDLQPADLEELLGWINEILNL